MTNKQRAEQICINFNVIRTSKEGHDIQAAYLLGVAEGAKSRQPEVDALKAALDRIVNEDEIQRRYDIRESIKPFGGTGNRIEQ